VWGPLRPKPQDQARDRFLWVWAGWESVLVRRPARRKGCMAPSRVLQQEAGTGRIELRGLRLGAPSDQTTALTRRQARWAQALLAYDFQISYRAGKTNPADRPLRRPDYEEEKGSQNVMLPTFRNKLQEAIQAGEAPQIGRVVADLQEVGATLGEDQSKGTKSPGLVVPRAADELAVHRAREAGSARAKGSLGWRVDDTGILRFKGAAYVPPNQAIEAACLRATSGRPSVSTSKDRGRPHKKGSAGRERPSSEGPRPTERAQGSLEEVERSPSPRLQQAPQANAVHSRREGHRWLGPYEILERIGKQAYRLKLPLQYRAIHDVFHVSLLERYWKNIEAEGVEPPPEPEIVESEEEYKVEAVLDHRIVKRGRSQKEEYLIRWAGYTAADDQWIPKLDVGLPLIEAYHKEQSQKKAGQKTTL
ncbi:hypothetical protein V496_01957, partial [Pseudogymnoascus sp. VKM F-4515 (FW-2607)]